MALTAGTAEASTIYTPISVKVGFDNGFSHPGQATNLAGSVLFGFHTYRRRISSRGISYGSRGVVATIFRTRALGPTSFIAGSFQTLGCGCGTVKAMSAGAVWSGPGGVQGSSLLGGRQWMQNTANSASNTARTFGGPSFTDQYALFRFQPTVGSPYLYGWLEYSLTIQADAGVNPGDGPDVTLIGYAYDNAGAKLPAGQITDVTPEPAAFAQSALAALFLGAEGLRRWRKTRPQ